MKLKVDWEEKPVNIKFVLDTYYYTGFPYISAYIVDDNGKVTDDYGDATRCLPGLGLGANETIMDTNNVPELVKAMIDAGLVIDTHRTVTSGFCTYPICEITEKLYEETITIDE